VEARLILTPDLYSKAAVASASLSFWWNPGGGVRVALMTDATSTPPVELPPADSSLVLALPDMSGDVYDQGS